MNASRQTFLSLTHRLVARKPRAFRRALLVETLRRTA